jgi:hypothetical protein
MYAGKSVGFDLVGVEDLGQVLNLYQWLFGFSHSVPFEGLLELRA